MAVSCICLTPFLKTVDENECLNLSCAVDDETVSAGSHVIATETVL